MIAFKCNNCGKSFSVPDAYAGRQAKCKGCGTTLLVPVAAPLAVSRNDNLGEVKLSPRARRLLSDAEQIDTIFGKCDHIHIVGKKNAPPDAYEIEFSVKSLARDPKGKPIERMDHRVLIQLTNDYPRLSPQCSMLTPIFHPNFNESTICVGDHWTAGERLADLIVRIAEMLAYQAYNIQSPLDGEAAMWADLNQKKLPLDNRDMRPMAME